MPWVKLTDDWYDDAAMAAVGPLGAAMWITGLTWCNRNLTDGRIPRRQARKLIDLQGIAVDGEPLLADDVASQLVEVGLWSRTEDGYEVRNYLKYQPSREKVLADREKDRDRKSSRPGAGRKSSRPGDNDPDPDSTPPNGFRPESTREPGANPKRPVPVPDGLVENTSSRNSRGAGQPVDDDEISIEDIPDEVWEHYAKLRRERWKGTIDNPVGWEKSTRRNAKLELGAKARRWWGCYNISPRRLAECLIDDTAPRCAPLRRKTEATG